MKSIDVTPTWGQWGNIFYRFALSGERAALETLHPDMAKAFSVAEAFKAIQSSLSEEQLQQAKAVMDTEMRKQGIIAPEECTGGEIEKHQSDEN